MSKREKFEKRLLQLLLVLCAMAVVSFWMLGNLYAKYVTQAGSSSSASVGVFDIEDSNDLKETYVLNPSMTDTEDQTVTITMKNNSDVAARYTFSFATDGNLPLVITAKAPDGVDIKRASDGSNTWTVDKAAGQKLEENYQFVLALDDTAESYKYAGGVGSIQLTVTAEQIE